MLLTVAACTTATSVDTPVQVELQRPELFAYATECARRLGAVEPWSCLDGTLVPITRDGVHLAPGDGVAECDRPAWLVDDGCRPGSRVGRLTARDEGRIREDVDWVYICRRLSERPDDDPVFENVALIGHDRTTGDTCFFQGPDGFPVDTTRIPPPAEHPRDTPAGTPRSDVFWALTEATVLGSATCVRCHDSSAWIHSPWIDQIPLVPVSPLEEPYADLQTGLAPPSLDAPGNPCATCHRIGTGATCYRYLDFVTGRTVPARTRAAREQYPYTHTMPPDPPETELAWERDFGAAVDELRALCASATRAPHR